MTEVTMVQLSVTDIDKLFKGDMQRFFTKLMKK